jgi:hypothetical protein
MKTKFLFTILAVSMYAGVFAQVSINAQAIAGGSDNDYLLKLCRSKNGGLLATGYSASNHSGYKTQDSRGSYDYWVVKYSRNREKLWDKTIGGDTSDILVDAISTSDGGYLLGGNSWSGKSGEKTGNSRGLIDYWLVKLDGQGNIQWDKTLGSSGYDVLYDVNKTNDDGYILAGSLGLTKIDSKGNVQWQKKLSYLSPSSVKQTTDGGFILTGTFDPGNGFSFYMVKADNMLNKQWTYNLGWSYFQVTSYDAQQTNDGGFIAYGYGASSRDEADNYYYDYFINIVKTDSYGNVQWHPGPYNDPLYSATPAAIEGDFSMQETSDQGFIFGTTYSASVYFGEYPDYYLLKFSKNGNLKWTKRIGGNNYDVLMDIKKIGLNQYTLGGYSGSGISRDKTKKNLGGADYWMVAVTDATAAITTASIAAASATKKETKQIFVHPNPAKDILYVQTNGNAIFTLSDQSGKILFTKVINGKSEINVSKLAAGLYYLKNNATGEVRKVIVIN